MIYQTGKTAFYMNRPSAVSIGKFDGLHRGHRKLLREMLHWKEIGYKVAIFTFSTPPGALVARTMATMIMTNEERVSLLQEAGVDYLVEYPFDEKVSRMDPEQFESYLMIHRGGMPPHGGLGMGLERFTARLLEQDNVRRACLFPRDIHRIAP